MILNPRARVPVAAMAVAFIVVLGIVSARQAASDFYAHTISLEIESWRQPGHKFRGDELVSSISSMEKSLAIAPGSAWALEQMGVLQLGQVRSATDPQVAVRSAHAAHASFKKALGQHPTSPFAWANLAMAKLYLGEIDAELFNAVARAAEYGPWEAQPQFASLTVGLAAWGQASGAQRETILGIRDRAMMRNPDKVNEIAKGFSRFDLMCDKKSSQSPGGRPCPRSKG